MLGPAEPLGELLKRVPHAPEFSKELREFPRVRVTLWCEMFYFQSQNQGSLLVPQFVQNPSEFLPCRRAMLRIEVETQSLLLESQ